MGPSLPVMTMIEGIVEEASDQDKESPEKLEARSRKGKWVTKEMSTVVDLPNEITREVTVTTEKLVKPTRGLTFEI